MICAFDGSALTAEGGEVVAAQPATPATNADNAAAPLAHSTSRREIAMAFVLGSMSTSFHSRSSLPPNAPDQARRAHANRPPLATRNAPAVACIRKLDDMQRARRSAAGEPLAQRKKDHALLSGLLDLQVEGVGQGYVPLQDQGEILTIHQDDVG